MQNEPIVPEGWILEKVKVHYDAVYWGLWALHLLSSLMPGVSPEPPAADVSYTLRRKADGSVHTVRLSGSHTQDTLIKTTTLLDAQRAAE